MGSQKRSREMYMAYPNLFYRFVEEYKTVYLTEQKQYDNSLLGEVKKIKDALLDEKFKPSVQLKNILNKQIKRAVYPIEVAIIGQFSSGKSTFLNALLAKDILPTGITPVTSKVIYINYGEEHRLKVTYRSGVHEYHPIEKIAMFSDQRVSKVEDIKYLTIYAPVEILKEMSFVDTPGLNSQSGEDTQSTRKVFNDVGGIIWLTLIDNAGKRSEEEVLDRYISAFKTKSLCILNQKDKFTQAQIETSTAYIEEKFQSYFSKVIAISAKKALDARALEPAVLIDNAMNRLIKDFRTGLQHNPLCDSLQFSDDFTGFKEEIEKIKALDLRSVEEEVQSSNINEVLAYIENVMRPNADELKAFRIKNDLKNICDILINAYTTIGSVYDSLSDILEGSEQKSLEDLDEINLHYSKDLKTIYRHIEEMFETASSEIYRSVSVKEAFDFKVLPSSFLQKEKIEKYGYETFVLDSNKVMNRLFYNEMIVENLCQKVLKELKLFEDGTQKSLENIYREMEDEVGSWQNKYLLLSKNREISSDLEFSKVKRFASKVHENILSIYHTAILGYIEALNRQSSYLQGALSYNLKQTVQVTLSEIEEKIMESEVIYKKDPSKFSIYRPSEEEILDRLKMHFNFERLEGFMFSKNHYLFKMVKEAKKEFSQITDEKKDFIAKEKMPFLENMYAIEKIKQSIVPEHSSSD